MSSPASSPPPEKKYKDLATISMVVDEWDQLQLEQLSPVVRVEDYNWRLRLHKFDSKLRYLSLTCDKSREAALWECIVTVKSDFTMDLRDFSFASWMTESTPRYITLDEFVKGTTINVEIVKVNGERPRLRPILDPYCERDGIIWIGRQKIHVNMQSLSSQSAFFKEFFEKEHKRNKPNEFVLQNVAYEEFVNVLNIFYGFDGAVLTDQNVHSIFCMASRFDLKIVEDRVISHLLSSCCSYSIHQKLVMADCNLPFLKKKLIGQYSTDRLKELCDAQEWAMLNPETTRELMKKVCNK